MNNIMKLSVEELKDAKGGLPYEKPVLVVMAPVDGCGGGEYNSKGGCGGGDYNSGGGCGGGTYNSGYCEL